LQRRLLHVTERAVVADTRDAERAIGVGLGLLDRGERRTAGMATDNDQAAADRAGGVAVARGRELAILARAGRLIEVVIEAADAEAERRAAQDQRTDGRRRRW
jgi:hypothetical protein